MKEDLADRLGADARPAPVSAPVRNRAAFIWSVADLLRDDYKRSEYGKVILPLTVLRRLDGVLAPTKQQVLERYAGLPKSSTPSSTALPAYS